MNFNGKDRHRGSTCGHKPVNGKPAKIVHTFAIEHNYSLK